MTKRRYAENTKVPPERSIEELRRLASRYEAEEFTYAMSPRGGSAMFVLGGIPIRYDVPFPTDLDTVTAAEQEYARLWRVVCLRAKGQFEALDAGDSPTRAFLAQLMLEDGSTLGDRAEAGDLLAGGLLAEALPALMAGPA